MKRKKIEIIIIFIYLILAIVLIDYYFESKQKYHLEFAPYIHWKAKSDSNHITILKNGNRKTINQNKQKEIKIIWMFGGSTLFCANVADSQTISSYLSKELNNNYIVRNFGQPGFIFRQQLYYLLNQLIETNQIPDIIIFYDGINDILNTARNGKSGTLAYQEYREKDFQMSTSIKKRMINYYTPIIAKFRNKFNLKLSPIITKNLIEKEISQSIQILCSLSEYYNFKVYHFNQPTIFTKKILTYSEKEIHNKYHNLQKYFLQDYYLYSYDIADIFDNSKKEIFEDFCHINARGNKLIAEQMAKIIRNQ